MKLPRRSLVSVGLRSAALLLSGTALLSGCTQEVVVKPVRPQFEDAPAVTGLPDFMAGTVHERALITNTEPYRVSSYGLVGQLRGTGDSTASNPVRQYMVKEMVRRGFGDPNTPGFEHISATDVLRDPNYAIVRVDSFIPAGARKDDFIDAQVTCLAGNRTSSLVHGVLFETDLKNAGADIDNPAGAVNTFVRVKGAILVNPAYALENAKDANAQAKASLRNGTVMFNARVMQDRPIMIRLRQPQLTMARVIEDSVRYRFQENFVAQALNEAIVNLYVPARFQGDWEHFSELVRHMYVRYDADFQVAKAKQLVAEAVKPNAPLEDISYCLEGIGLHALAPMSVLLNHPDPKISFYIARATACIGDGTGAAESRLVQMARTQGHPYQLMAVKALGALPPSSALNSRLHPLLSSDLMLVRVEAYRILARNRDAAVLSVPIAPTRNPDNQKFILDVVQTDAPPIVYISRLGKPRIALIGRMPVLNAHDPITLMDARLTIAGQDRGRYALLFYRDPTQEKPIRIPTQLTMDRVIARLAGMSSEESGALNFSFGEIAAILQALVKENRLEAIDPQGATVAVSFVMQEPARVMEDLIGAQMYGGTASADFAPGVGGGTEPVPGTGSNAPQFGAPVPASTPAVANSPGTPVNTPKNETPSNAPKF